MALAGQMSLVVGLTGGFGSGCTTLAGVLANDLGFHSEALSTELRDEWGRHHEGTPLREELQLLGDQMRKSDTGILARRAVERADSQTAEVKLLALDGIRNVGEIEYLQQRFGDRFFLFAVDAPTAVRWQRVRAEYAARDQGEEEFGADDNRDKDEETPWGQQVQLCVDRSDVQVLNAERLGLVQRRAHFKELLSQHVGLLTGEHLRYPTQDEVLMNTAFSAANQTRCLKRQVGAVIATKRGEPISVGYNENPDSIKPCVDQFGECYRDRIRNEHFERLAERASCPACGHKIRPTVGPPWRCGCHDDKSIDCQCRVNLENYFFPGRAMNWCTALHAEERAIINARGRDLADTVLYTTAFPCFLCAEKILQAGIRRIIFTEAYPDPYSGELLEAADPEITIEKFEGVRSGKFDRIFGGVRAHKEAEIDGERRRAAGLT
jgi:deoxycytidylate deaminase